MPTYQFYVRGHGGEEQHRLPSGDLPIDMITVGQFGSTMSDEVADSIIFHHLGIREIEGLIQNETIIYWTKAQRDDWYQNGKLNFSTPALSITPYETLTQNLALDGDSTIGKCGVCYWNEAKGGLVWVIALADRETILLSQILATLTDMLGEGDVIQLFWTACMSAEYWSGNRKKVSFNPLHK